MSSTGGTSLLMPPPGGNRDRGPQLMAMFWTETVFAILTLSLRFYARWAVRSIGMDDWLMLITVILFTIMAAFVTKLALVGGSRHVYYLTAHQGLEAVYWSWISTPWGIFLFFTGKASVSALIVRIMGKVIFWRRWILYILIASLFIVSSLGVILQFVQCDPPRALWTPSIKGKCWDPHVKLHYDYFMTAWNMLADVLLSVIPVTIVAKLKIRKQKKVVLCCFLSLGLFAALFSGLKARYLKEVGDGKDATWNAYDIQAWTGAEAFVMIICGNIPPMQPLWERFIAKDLGSNSDYGSTPLKYSYGNPSQSSRSYNQQLQPEHSTMAFASKDAISDTESYGLNLNLETMIDHPNSVEWVGRKLYESRTRSV